LLLQIHVRGGEVMYFSRRGREHGRLSDYVVFDDVVRHQVRRWCIKLVWCIGSMRLLLVSAGAAAFNRQLLSCKHAHVQW
jgi:hypothetical protein